MTGARGFDTIHLFIEFIKISNKYNRLTPFSSLVRFCLPHRDDQLTIVEVLIHSLIDSLNLNDAISSWKIYSCTDEGQAEDTLVDLKFFHWSILFCYPNNIVDLPTQEENKWKTLIRFYLWCRILLKIGQIQNSWNRGH